MRRLLAPILGATASLTFATVAHGAQDTPSTNDPAKAEGSSEPTPEATTVEGTEVASAQVEGSASVSTTGATASATGESGGLQGTFGLGAIRTLGGLTGINARYFALDKLSIGVNVGIGTFTFAQNDPASTDVCPGADCEFEDQRTVASLGFGLEGIYWVHQGNPAGQLPFRADFGVGGRFTYLQGINSADVENNLDDPTEFDIEIPMVVQLRFGDHFVLSPEFGLNFIIVPGTRQDGDVNPGTYKPDTTIAPGDPSAPLSGPGFGFQLTNGIGLFGGASLHYYF